LGVVYAAQEDFDLSHLSPTDDGHSGIEEALRDFAEQVREVASEYSDAAEAFGGQGENQERADELESWADEVENAVSGEESESPKCEAHQVEPEDCNDCKALRADGEDEEAKCDVHSVEPEECDACKDEVDSWWENLCSVAVDAVGSCPL
jgi:hypothetical protein